MKIFSFEPAEKADRSSGIVSRFFLLSAAVGLLIGIFEAYLLWTRPRVIPLLVPDVGYVIWFLAPLVDMLFFGLLGLGLGWIARRTRGREVLVAVEGGIIGTFLILMVAWFHFEIGLHPFRFNQEVQIPFTYFAVISFACLLVFSAGWPWLARLAEPPIRALIKGLAIGIATIAATAVAGIIVFAIKPTFLRAAKNPVSPPPGAPNIILITLDTVRADHLSGYGHSRPTTPNLDSFARTGVLFENAITAAPWTLASHSSMFTGLLPHQHGADWSVPLAANPWTSAEVLRSQGYQTASFVGNSSYLQRGWGIAQGFELYNDSSSYLRHNLAQTFLGRAMVQPLFETLGPYDSFDRRSAQELNASFMSWSQHRPHRPAFVFLNYFDAHEPYTAPAPYAGRFGEAPKGLIRKLHYVSENDAQPSSIDPRERRLLEASYDNCLAYLDAQLGQLLRYLRQAPDWQNTIVIITSDHGEEFGRRGHYIHGFDLYRPLLHVPLIIAGPGVPQDVRISHLAATRQLFSTVLDLAGGGKTLFSRTSLARFWDPNFQPEPFDNALVSQLIPVFHDAQHATVSLTTSQWHYIEHHSGRQELYDWTVDPAEQHNLAEAPEQRSTVATLHSRLIGLVGDATGPWKGPQYLLALGAGSSPQIESLIPKPFQPQAPGPQLRIGMAQAYFKPDDSDTPARPRLTESQRELMRSLPYQ